VLPQQQQQPQQHQQPQQLQQQQPVGQPPSSSPPLSPRRADSRGAARQTSTELGAVVQGGAAFAAVEAEVASTLLLPPQALGLPAISTTRPVPIPGTSPPTGLQHG
jgi:hypothetical protein